MTPGEAIRLVAMLILAPALAGMTGCAGDTAGDSGVPCTLDDECGIGEICDNGICKPFNPKTCTFDDDCDTDEFCDDGVCTPGSRPDGGDGGDADGGDDETPVDGGDEGPVDQDQPEPQITLAGDVIVREDQHGKTYEINYGNVAVGIPVSRTLIVRNTGELTLEVTVITIDEDPEDEFVLEPDVPPALSIEPGEEESLAVNYQATDGLTDRAVAKVFSNDPDEGELHIQLISEFKGEARISLDPVVLEFGDVPLAQPTTLPVTISNQGTGNAVLTVDSAVPEAGIATAYEVQLIDPNDESELAPPVHINSGDFIRADVTFLAPSRGSFDGDLIVESSDDAASPSTVALRGRAGTPAMVIAPESIDFGQVPDNTWAPDQTLTISNEGVGDLHVDSIEPAVGSSADIHLEGLPGLPLILPPDGESSFTVRYNPTDVGADMATIVFVHDDPDRQPDVRVNVGGEGIQGNARPSAVIRANGQDTALLVVGLNERVDLDGQDSFDNDGSVTAYEWRIVSQPSVHPCGQASTLSGTMNPVTFIILREAGLTQIGLRVQDDLDAWSDEDLVDIQVSARPEADIRVGGNDTGYIEVDMGDTLTFDGGFSTDCDGIVTGYQWSIVDYPPGRGAPPPIGGGDQHASILFDFPGNYTVGLVTLDNDVPQNASDQAVFDVMVRGPKAFRVTADWFDRGDSDHHVDVDLHLLKPGSTDVCTADESSCSDEDCCPDKDGVDACHPDPNWGVLGTPVYQRDSYEDGDGVEPPDTANPADEINHTNPGMGEYDIYVHFRCHSSTNLGGYLCCDDVPPLPCPFSIACNVGEPTCGRRAEGTVIVYVTDYDNNETEIVRRGFAIDSEQTFATYQIGTLSWPDGNFQ